MPWFGDMRHFSTKFTDATELISFLQQDDVRDAVISASSVLAQIYTGTCEESWVDELGRVVADVDDKIVFVGATTFGEIEGGTALSGTTVVSLICFDAARLDVVELSCASRGERAAAKQLADRLAAIPEEVKGVLLLATPLTLDCGALLAQLHYFAPTLPLFGGAAGHYGDRDETFVFSRAGSTRSGLVAVALSGAALEISRHSYLGWVGMGKPMTITGADDYTLRTIDNRPALELYQQYLGIEDDAQFFHNAIEYPLLVERDGHTVARAPVGANDDGSLRMIADVRVGETAYFGSAHVDTIQREAYETLKAVQAFDPEVINIYGCGCRYSIMEGDIGLELVPFQTIAPAAGFFTFGEFFSRPTISPLLNNSLVIIGLREAGRSSDVTVMEKKRKAAVAAHNIYAHSHMRVLSRFQHFVHAITDDLERANTKLASLADRDYLTGLYNRRMLKARLDEEFERSRRYTRVFSLVFADIDKFKRFNDNYGHSAGDSVLAGIAALMTKSARAGDVVTRYGGEEFVLLLTDTNRNQAKQAAERVRVLVEGLRLEHDGQALPRVSASFGVACFPDDAATPEEVLAMADRMLYRAKRAGRNRVCAAK